MKTQREIEQQMIQTVTANTERVTSFVVGSVIRSILTAVAAVTAEIWNDLVAAKRRAFTDTAQGADLDALGSRRGLTRLGASKSSVILIFTGGTGTIPAGTQVRSAVTGIVYTTLHTVVMRSKNPAQGGNLFSPGLADATLAESLLTGAQTRAAAGTLTAFVTPMPGITVSNPSPSLGGADIEADDQFAARIRMQPALLSQATQAFYEATAQTVDPTVLRARAEYDPTTGGALVYLVKDSGASYSSGWLLSTALNIADRQRCLDRVKCANITWTTITVSIVSELVAPANVDTVAQAMSDALSDFLNWRTWDWGRDVLDDDILAVLKRVPNAGNIDVTAFRVNGLIGDIAVGDNSLPRLVGLRLVDSATDDVADYTIEQNYGSQV